MHVGNFRGLRAVSIRVPPLSRTSLRRIGLLAGLAAALALTGCGGTSSTAAGVVVELNDNDGYAGALIDPGYLRPTDSFTDTSGAPWTFTAGATRPVTLVTFGYTSCPDVCSAQLADLVAALRRVDPGVRQRIQVVWISVDPDRDTPEVIRTYLDRFDSTMVGLSASDPVLERAAGQLGVGLSGETQVEDGYEVGHGAHIIGFGPGGVSVVWVQGTPVGDLRADISRLASAA